jgi:cardiolipin synthase
VLSGSLAPLLAREDSYIARLADEKPKSYKRRLLQLVQRNSNSALTGRNMLEILQNAEEKYPRLLDDLHRAEHSIHMEYYIWTDDEFTQRIKEVLIEQAQAGVEIRLLYDASGGKLGQAYVTALRNAGAQIFAYRPYQSPLKLHTINYRSHRKIAILDGKIGYVGGLNLDQEQLDGGRHFDFWRDTHLRIRGEATQALQAIFVTSWYNTSQEKISGAIYFPPPDDDVNTFLPIQITTSGPDSQWGAIRQLYFSMITSAEEKIYVQSPFFIPDVSVSEALKAAALSGVDVKMMFAPRGTTYRVPYWAANTYFQEMAEAGVRVFLYQKGYFHPKTLNIDGAVCSIGTANMDIRSFSINYEVNAVIYDQATAEELEEDFLEDLRYCTEFTLEEYHSHTSLSHFRDSLCRLASPLL